MRFLLDTCVISEMLRELPAPSVVQWLSSRAEDRLFLSALVLGELYRGVALLESGKKRVQLETWIPSLESRFEGRILPLTEKECACWGRLSAELQRKGIALPLADGLIAATALTHKMTLVTRNEKDMRACGVRIANPWE